MHDVWLHPTDKTSLILFIFTTMATRYSTLTLCNYLSVLLVSTLCIERKASEREGGREGSENKGGRGQRERREEGGRQGERKGRR